MEEGGVASRPVGKMKIAVIGPGAMGCLLAVLLSEANEVLLLDHNRERVFLLNERGLILEENGRSRHCLVKVVTEPDYSVGSVELVLLCVKAGGFPAALQTARLLCDKNSLILTLQNGIGHLPSLAKLPDGFDWALGVTSHGATLVGPGHVLHKGRGLTKIGLSSQFSNRQDGAGKKLLLVSQTLTAAGIETEVVDDILNHVWGKLLVNVGINALTAIHDCPNGALLESDEAHVLMQAAILEGKEVAEQSGILLAEDPLHAAERVCRATANNISSMLQDVRAEKVTEIDAINGALVRQGAQLGIATPVNIELVRKIKEIESNYNNFT